jgi:hypothetical protein
MDLIINIISKYLYNYIIFIIFHYHHQNLQFHHQINMCNHHNFSFEYFPI